MSAIDMLKDEEIEIDVTENETEIEIDATSTDENNESSGDQEKVDLSSLVTAKRGNKQIVKEPKRTTVSVDSIAKKEEKSEEQHVSPIDDMLNPENPNSMFSKYVEEKESEAREWIAEKEEEKAILAAEDEDDIINENSTMSEETEVEYHTEDLRNVKVDDDLDVSSIINNSDVKEDEEIKEEPKQEAIGKIKKESIDAPDIKVEETVDTFSAAVIEEEESTTNVGEVDDNEVLKHLQKLATERLKPVSKQLDISSFTILKKPVTNVTPIFQESNARVIKWVLPGQESIVLMKEFSGSELEKLREYSENSRSVDSLNRRFNMIYEHIVSPKPATFEAWLKSTPFNDIDHYFFAIYVACFKGANYLPADCINKDCKETFLTEDTNIMDMVKFDNEESKELFGKLYQSEATPAGKGVYCTEVVPLNNKIAISFREPSIYNTLEIVSLDEKSRNNFSSIIDYIPYIDTIYIIDEAAQTLTPITYKMFPDNNTRTIRSKIQKYDSIFNTLSVDEFGPIKAYIRAISEKTTGMHYVYPSVECPKCHTVTEEQAVSAEELVFTRYQLGGLVTTLLN